MATTAPSTRKTPDRNAPAEAAPAPKKKSRALLYALLAAGLLVLAGGGGGAAWLLLKPAETADAKGASKKAEKKAEKPKPPVYVAIETFTVNLQPENGEHLLQTTFSLKVADAAVEQAIKLHLPEVRSRMLLLLSSKRPSELGSIEGKQALANQIAEEVNRILGPAAPKPAAGAEGAAASPVLSVFFTNFIIQ